MIVSVRDPNILSNLDPQQLINYLMARGWQPENLGGNANNQESVWVLTASSGSEFDITLPLHRKTRSFALRMAEILETLEKAEGRSQLDILSDLVTLIPNVEIPGMVIRLAESNHTLNVIIMGFVIGKPQEIHTLFHSEEYQLARMAYTERLAVVCTGDLIKQNGNFVLLKPSGLALYDALSNATPQTPHSALQINTRE
ncbi:hypothetical protein [Nostoc sphaeroides]|uniref:Uncharacterized protein n=1 Tax=Nostoc sphaeroides CCNUC1 TaxID=2653204 RepID=A0A5P8WJG9_9NOSO|nr:hypothetical protein [Nostoc sphaeroides]QFS52296.1 hypothetical protein GXM_09790 [Nostoc sphaeroides CCNUC1]